MTMKTLGFVFATAFVVAFATIAQRVPTLTAGTFSRLAISAAIIAALPTLMVWGISQLVKFFSPTAHASQLHPQSG